MAILFSYSKNFINESRNASSDLLIFQLKFINFSLVAEESSVTLEDILVFATGADKIPPLGFPSKPKLCFLHDEQHLYPRGNTCGLILYLPVVHRNYDSFKYNMDFGILNANAFALT